MKQIVNIIGAGLAGSEAAYQLAKRGISVNLYEMKPKEFSPAHSKAGFAELVCSNSFRSNELSTAPGLLKEELRRLDSLVIKYADKFSVPAGGALAVDREQFSLAITDHLKSMPNINIIHKRIDKLDLSKPTIVATGPLTAKNLSEDIRQILGQEYLYFFDAAAPIIEADSIDSKKVFKADRYQKGNADYINCPLTKEEYEVFYNELINAQTVQKKSFEKEVLFEGCMPIEKLAKRGYKSLLFGPLKPVGLAHPISGQTYFAVVQLRKETISANLYNMVGFQTTLTFGEQKRVFGLIPGLKNASFVRYGLMHRNTFLNAPSVLNRYYQLIKHKNIFVAGQLSGVEGYIESISSGLYASLNMHNLLKGNKFITFDKTTAIGAIANYISSASPNNFQPMNVNFGIIQDLDTKIKDKKQKRLEISKKALESLQKTLIKGEKDGTI